VTSVVTGVGFLSVHVVQLFNSLEIVNARANINIQNHTIISSGLNLYRNNLMIQDDNDLPKYQISSAEAFQCLAFLIDWDTKSSIAPTSKLVYIATGNSLRLTWEFWIYAENNYYNAHVDAETCQVKNLVDCMSSSSFQAYPLGTVDPTQGQREVMINPEGEQSPIGWNSLYIKSGEMLNLNVTKGNNVLVVAKDANGKPAPSSSGVGQSVHFVWPIDLGEAPSHYLAASSTNAFYLVNVLHDLFFKFGFDETSGNFQDSNFGIGGKDKDAVLVIVQAIDGLNYGDFITPPDGNPPRMRLSVSTRYSPTRDSALDSGLIIHEYGHGVSSRLTGGPSNSNCLSAEESLGLGEGWSDFFAAILQVTKSTPLEKPFTFAIYLKQNLRKYTYSPDFNVNPDTYGNVYKPSYEDAHNKGGVWAVILYDIFWKFVEKYGFKDWLDSGNDGGNRILLILVINGLKLQPCNPSFLQARDAIILSDQVIFNGENQCLLWNGFARRGLGVNAVPGEEDFGAPEECRDEAGKHYI
jgi:extracellular elastinolytic metalloproteinase